VPNQDESPRSTIRIAGRPPLTRRGLGFVRRKRAPAGGGWRTGARKESVLPQVTAAEVSGIHHLGVPAVEAAQQDFERILAARNQYQMDVIRHQTPGKHPRLGWRQVLLEQPEVGGSIRGREENPLVIGPPLGDVISQFRNDAAHISRHSVRRVPARRRNSPICGSAPTCWPFSPRAHVRLSPSAPLRPQVLPRSWISWVPLCRGALWLGVPRAVALQRLACPVTENRVGSKKKRLQFLPEPAPAITGRTPVV
jgi:hypothetical protein